MRRFVLAIAVTFALVGCGVTPATRSTNTGSATTTPPASPTGAALSPQPVTTAIAGRASAEVAVPSAIRATSTASPAIEWNATPHALSEAPRTSVPGTPLDLATEHVSSYTDSSGALYFIGEVVNRGQGDATAIQIAISLIDAAGNTVATGRASTIGVYLLKGGARTVWSALISGKPAAWQEQRIQVQGGLVTPVYAATFADGLAVTGVTINPPTNQYSFVTASGQVQNTGAATARFPTVTLGAYDAAGRLTSVSLGSSALQEIAPGASAPFTVTLYNTTVVPTTYDIYVKGTK